MFYFLERPGIHQCFMSEAMNGKNFEEHIKQGCEFKNRNHNKVKFKRYHIYAKFMYFEASALRYL